LGIFGKKELDLIINRVKYEINRGIIIWVEGIVDRKIIVLNKSGFIGERIDIIIIK